MSLSEAGSFLESERNQRASDKSVIPSHGRCNCSERSYGNSRDQHFNIQELN